MNASLLLGRRAVREIVRYPEATIHPAVLPGGEHRSGL
jgi:hypothetical protein